jgi:2-polyprenyl-3-methyl-5-hydroxy-6-metoxy-1,4-benzoquinol methylase
MTTPDISRIDQPWPDEELERIDCCPYCDSSERTLAHRDVQDWSFYCAPGKWTYWNCTRCSSLYLSPRPTPAALDRAYGTYYTHRVAHEASLWEAATDRLRNECWSHWLEADLRPRVGLPRALGWLLAPLKSRLIEPFEIAELVKLPKGRLLDVGCGSGHLLSMAQHLGWQAVGLDIDPMAARAARARGLEVLVGSYDRLADFRNEVDCIICSHVLEHVHDPRDLLCKVATALKPGGALLLSLPNATSVVRHYFGDDWRGLEAPRHLTIPSMSQLKAILRDMGFSVRQRHRPRLWTVAESSRIRRRGTRLNRHDRAMEKNLRADDTPSHEEQYDFVEFVCVNGGRHVV